MNRALTALGFTALIVGAVAVTLVGSVGIVALAANYPQYTAVGFLVVVLAALFGGIYWALGEDPRDI